MICLPVKQSDQKLGLFMKTINNLHEILKEHKKNMHKCILILLLHSKIFAQVRHWQFTYKLTSKHTLLCIVAVHKVDTNIHCTLKQLASAVKSLNTTHTTDGQLKYFLW